MSNRTQFGMEGEYVTLECAALSVPKPDDIRWYFENREISIIQDPVSSTRRCQKYFMHQKKS